MELALDQFLFSPFRAQHNAQHRVEQENLHAHAQKSALGKKMADGNFWKSARTDDELDYAAIC